VSELQGVAHDISEDARKAIQRARKILDMASRPPSDDDTPAQRAAKEAERAVAAEKFQAVLLEYNLTQAMVEQAGGETDGRREEAKLKAGVYEWQRNLWEAVAELNFCLYFCQDVWRERSYTKTLWDGSKAKRNRYVRGKEHRVIGRTVNTQATINLCTYIEAAIEQATRERLREAVGSDDKQALNWMLFSRYAVSFREGAADDVIGRVNKQREQVLAEEARKAVEARKRQDAAMASGVSDGTSLVLADFIQTEADLNRDHARGVEPGTTARQRHERAARAAAEEAAYTAWAAANPEEAAAKEKERREENERYWRRGNANYRGGPAPKERDYSAYNRGAKAGAAIGLDIQTGGSKAKGSLS
jgi:hypothetical protein